MESTKTATDPLAGVPIDPALTNEAPPAPIEVEPEPEPAPAPPRHVGFAQVRDTAGVLHLVPSFVED